MSTMGIIETNNPLRDDMNEALRKAWEHLKATNPKYLGGTTGAVRHTLPTGKKVVVKRGGHPAHIRNEFDFNRYLNEIGVGVPDAVEEKDVDGQPLMVSEYEEGAVRPSIHNEAHMEALRRDFTPQALIANWDLLGMDMDNTLIRPDGTPTAVDVGGSGPYRAQGQHKNTTITGFSPTVGELDSMRWSGDLAPNRGEVYGGMTRGDMGRSWDNYGGQDAMESALSVLRDKNTRKVMGQRIEDLARQVA